MPWIDLLIVAILVISTVVSSIRGFAKDAISLAAWILAFIVAMSLADKFALILPQSMEDPRLRIGLAFVVLFLATLVMGMVANFMFAGFINLTKTHSLNRGLGVIFGLVRGVVIVCLMVVLGSFIGLNEVTWWQGSALLPIAETIIGYLVPILPDNLTQFIKR